MIKSKFIDEIIKIKKKIKKEVNRKKRDKI